MSRDERVEDDLIWLLRHRVRRRILMAVGDAGRIGATSLRDQLGISTGSLYYNLKQLERLVQQDSKRNYVLTEEGQAIYKLLKARGDLSSDVIRSRPNRLESTLASIFFPLWLMAPILEKTTIALPSGLISILFLSALLINSKLEIILLHIYHKSVFTLSGYATMLSLTIVTIYFYISIVTYFHERLLQRGGEREVAPSRPLRALVNMLNANGQGLRLLATVMMGLLPMSIYPAADFIDRVFGYSNFVVQDSVPVALLPNLILVVSQMGSFVLLTTALSYVKRLKWHVSAVISFSLIYLSIIVQYFIVSYA